MKKIKFLNSWHLVWLIVLFSWVLAAVVNLVQGVLFGGHVSSEILWTGSIDALLVSLAVSLLVVPVFKNLTRLESEKDFLQKEISERRKMEAALKESEERFGKFADQSPNMIFINKGGRIVYANNKCQEIMGYIREEYYSAEFNFLDLVAPEHKVRIVENFKKHMAGREIDPYEYTLITKGGSRLEALITTRLVDFQGEKAILGIVTDITAQKGIEKALRESEERYRAVVNQSSEGIILYDLESKRVMEANPAYLSLLGYSLKEIQRLTIYDIAAHERKNIDVHIQEIIKEGRRFVGERNHRRKDGSLISVSISGAIISYGQGQAMCLIARDNTEQKRAEKERLILEEQLRQAQKMEAIGRLAGGVAHDFNNLLTVIQGYSDLILGSLGPDGRLRQEVQEIQKATERASSLTQQLLAFSRKQILQPKILDLNGLVGDVEKMLRRMIGEDIELIAFLDPALGKIKADPGQLEQVILNLAINARDAMPQGGKFYLETTNAEVDEGYTRLHAGLTPGRYVKLSIRDTGTGMAPEIKEKIFEPFFTTKEKGKGTGLGLSTIYGIVKQSGGYIAVFSEIGKGSRFEILLPRIEEEIPVYKQCRAQIKPVPGGLETILLVEDEEMVRTLASTILRMFGYRVLEAGNGEEGLDVFQQEDNHPIHLILTDVVMPGISGRQMVEQIWSWRPEIKALYMSGYTEEAMDSHGIFDTKTAFMQKPFTPQSLANRVREVLDG